MIRKTLDKYIENITDKEFKLACLLMKVDIIGNNIEFNKKTTFNYLITRFIATVHLIRNVYKEIDTLHSA